MPESTHVTFTGCKHLDYSDNYTAKKNLIQLGGTTKLCWDRKEFIGHVDLVQFCKLRGRLNSPEACHCEEMKMCSEYEDVEHSIPIETIDLS